jgi:glutathione synthase/RimK-type ligase-like ATP-grasp enzyme
MQKQLLIITSNSEKTVAWLEREKYVKEFCEGVEELVEGIKVRYTTYDDLEFSVVGGMAKIYDTRNKQDLNVVTMVHFKNWVYEAEEAPVAASYLKKHGTYFVNSEVETPVASGKLSQMFRLGENGVAVPDTFYARRPSLLARAKAGKLPDGIPFPFIMKASDASKGDDNYLVKDFGQMIEILESVSAQKQFVLQRFIENDGDYRYLFIGLEDEPLVFLRKSVDGSHLNNTSKGGSGEFVECKSLPQEYLYQARKAAEILGREISGVDIIVDKAKGDAYILEVNGTPALATGYGTDVKLRRFAKYLQQTLEQQEEE